MVAKAMCPSNKCGSGIHGQLRLLSQAAAFKNLVIDEKRMAFLADATNVILVECSRYSSKLN